MQWLHTGHHAEFAEAVNVLRTDGLDVLDARSGVFCLVYFCSLLVGIERQTDCFVSDGMRKNLKAATVKGGDSGFVLIGIPKKLAAL